MSTPKSLAILFSLVETTSRFKVVICPTCATETLEPGTIELAGAQAVSETATIIRPLTSEIRRFKVLQTENSPQGYLAEPHLWLIENGSMWDLFAIGFVAGLALAIPVGPMAIMLVNTTVSRGLRHGVVGALGMASVDGAYALTVFIVGGLIAAALASIKVILALVGAGILLILGVSTAIKNWRLLGSPEGSSSTSQSSGSTIKTYLTFVLATVVNPPTALYFLAIAPNVANMGFSLSVETALLFALSVFAGSLIWQEGLVFAGLAIRGITSNRFRVWFGLIGGILIIALAISIGLNAL